MPRTAKAKGPPPSDMMRVLGVESLSRIDPDEDFSDVDGDPQSEFALDNQESDREYVFVRNHPDDIGEYKGGVIPYRVEHLSKEGVRTKMGEGIQDGEAIQKRGHVLMSCDKELWQKRNRFQLAKTREVNDRMFRHKQRDLHLGVPGSLDRERAET